MKISEKAGYVFFFFLSLFCMILLENRLSPTLFKFFDTLTMVRYLGK